MLKQKFVAPWATKSEWHDVRKKIYSKKVQDVIEAYETMNMWRLRCDNLPALVDCTAGILQVMVQEYKNENLILSDHDLRLSYSTALIRFINHVHGISENKNNTLYRSAKTQNIPDWLITMRHDAAHGRTLPALETFHLAAKISLQWLLENYWVHEEKIINSLGAKHFGDDFIMSNININLLPIYKTAIKVWETCCDLMKNSLSLNSDLSEEQLSHLWELIKMCERCDSLQKDGLNCVVWLKKITKFSEKQSNCQPFTVKISKCLKIYITGLLKSMTNDDTARFAFVWSLLESDFMLDTTQSDWENVIQLVQALKCFQIFLECLFELVGDENDMALTLLDNLAQSIEVQRSVWSWYQGQLKKHKSLNTPKKKFKNMVQAKYKRECKKLTIRLKLQNPPKITQEMVHKLFMYGIEQSCEVGFRYLSFIDKGITTDLFYELEDLMAVYFGREIEWKDSCVVPDKIFTLEDIKSEFDKNNDGYEQIVDDGETKTWGKSEGSCGMWSKCPLGLLPHQNAVDCNLPKDVKWTLATSTLERRKRASSSLLTSQSEGMKKLKISLKNIDK